jgi:hypothetical protein
LIIESLNKLVCGPSGCRVFCHIKVKNLAAIMGEDDEDQQDAEGGRWEEQPTRLRIWSGESPGTANCLCTGC